MNLIKITNKPRGVLELDLIIGGSRQNEKTIPYFTYIYAVLDEL